jgi:hypothetical protein
MSRISLQQILVVVAVVATIAINALANILPINGQTTGTISDKYPVLFTPAGYVFAIWSLIYLGLVAFAIWQALPAQRDNPRLAAIRVPFLVGSVANMVWIFFWHYEIIPVTELLMLTLLLSLIFIYARLGIGRVEVSRAERWFVHHPFSLYLGWITIATIANTTILLYDLGWNGEPLSPALWTALIIAVAALIAGWLSFSRGDVVYGSVVVWALVGVIVKQGDVRLIAVAAGLAALVVAVAALRGFSQLRGLQRSAAAS